MSCYGCGSSEGNEARLCPSCNQARRLSEEQREARLTAPVDDFSIQHLSTEQKILAGAGAGLLLLSFAWLFSPSTEATTPLAVKGAYERCLKIGMERTSEIAPEEHQKEITATCDNLKAQCGDGETSPGCQSFMDEYAAPSE
jgi:hypothetical protein